MKLTLKSQAAIMATAISVAVVGLFGWSQREPIRREVMRQIKTQQTALVRESANNLRQRLDIYLGLLERTARQMTTVQITSPSRRPRSMRRSRRPPACSTACSSLPPTAR